MKKLHCFFIILLLPLVCCSQDNPQKFRQKSWQTFTYRITAAEAEQFVKWDSIPVSNFLDREPVLIFPTDSIDEDLLPVGNYVLLSVDDIYIKARFLCISNLVVLDINNKHSLQLDIRNKNGEFITDAKVFVNNTEAVYKSDSKTFWAGKIKSEEPFVKVYAPGDTLYLTLAEKEDYHIKSIGQQRWTNFQRTKTYSIFSWLPNKIINCFSHKKHYKQSRIGARGFIVFNQPKYKPLDTVKFKGYVVDKKWNQYKKNIEVHLSYYDKGKYFEQLISTLAPASPGAFVGQFVLADTIPLDISCSLVFKTADHKTIIQNYFKTEDYVLDEISTYNFRSDKKNIF